MKAFYCPRCIFLVVVFFVYQSVFGQNIYPYLEGTNFGIENEKGKKITDAVFQNYQQETYFKSLTLISKQSKPLITKDGGIISPLKNKIRNTPNLNTIVFQFDDECIVYSVKLGLFLKGVYEAVYSYDKLIWVKKDGKWGMIDEKGNAITEMIFDEFVNTMVYANWIGVKINNKYGFIDVEGKWIFKPQFDEIDYEFGNEFCFVATDGKWGCVNVLGQRTIDLKYDNLWYWDFKKYHEYYLDGRRGLIDFYGNEIFPNYQFVDNLTGADVFIVKNNQGKLGVVDEEENIIIKMEYDDIFALNANLFALKKEGLYLLYDTNSSNLPVSQFALIERTFFNNPRVFHVKKDGKFGLMNQAGELIVPIEYDDKIKWDKPCYIAQNGHHWMVYDTIGKVLFSNSTKGIQFEKLFHSDCFSFRKNNRVGILNSKGEVLVEPIYDRIEFPVNGYCRVKKGQRWGLINLQGVVIIPVIYEFLMPDSEQVIPVKSNNLWGFSDLTGKLVVQPQYPQVLNAKSGIAAVMKGNQWYILNTNDFRIYDQGYDLVHRRHLSTDKINVRLGTLNFEIDSNGKLHFND